VRRAVAHPNCEAAVRPQETSDITRVVLMVVVLGTLLVGSFLTLLPFLSGLTWATTIVVATWPAVLRLQQLVGGRRWLAITAMTLLVGLAFILPFAIAITTLIDAAGRSPAVMSSFVAKGLGPPPEWIGGLPVVGHRITDRWQTIADGGPEALMAAAQPYARSAAAWALAATGGLGRTMVLILMTLLLVPILYAQGETAARGVLAFAHRLGGTTAERTIVLAGQAVRSVALGVVLTALVQSVLAGLGLWICGVPHAGLLAAFAFVLGIAQVGPFLVMVPSVIWLYWTGSTVWATALLVWSVPVLALDNVLRPILIRRGVQLPMLLIIGGVIGGLISFGVVGLFVGPVILAATYTLAKDWVAREPRTEASETMAVAPTFR
jgi:predicted PurR-regulated permease PerM